MRYNGGRKHLSCPIVGCGNEVSTVEWARSSEYDADGGRNAFVATKTRRDRLLRYCISRGARHVYDTAVCALACYTRCTAMSVHPNSNSAPGALYATRPSTIAEVIGRSIKLSQRHHRPTTKMRMRRRHLQLLHRSCTQYRISRFLLSPSAPACALTARHGTHDPFAQVSSAVRRV